MADYPQTPFNPGGGGVFWQHTDPSTWMLYNNPPSMPAPTTTTLPPQADAGSAYAAPMPEMAGAGRLNAAEMGGTTGLAAMGVIPPAHDQYQMLHSLDHLARGGASPEDTYSLLQALINNGTLYPGEGGVGLGTSLPYGGPDAARTQRLIDLYERYQDFLKGGGMPAPTMSGPTGSYPMPRFMLGTVPPP